MSLASSVPSAKVAEGGRMYVCELAGYASELGFRTSKYALPDVP
jgi:hypothetical protein